MIGVFLRAWAATQADLRALIGTGNAMRLAPWTTQQGLGFPRITYFRVTETDVNSLDGPRHLKRSLYQIEAQAQSQDEADAISELLRGDPDRGDQRLSGFRGTLGGVFVQGVHLESAQDVYDEPINASDLGVYRVIHNYVIWHARA